MALSSFDVRMEVIDPKITAESQIIGSRAIHKEEIAISSEHEESGPTSLRLASAYRKVHAPKLKR
jgi:hypothetical protein